MAKWRRGFRSGGARRLRIWNARRWCIRRREAIDRPCPPNRPSSESRSEVQGMAAATNRRTCLSKSVVGIALLLDDLHGIIRLRESKRLAERTTGILRLIGCLPFAVD